MSSLFIVLAVVILAFFAYSIKLWFDYKKVAVQSKGYAKTSGIYFLLLAFMTLTGVLSLSDKLLNLLLTKIGIPALDLSQHMEYKWMMFAAFIVFAIAVVFILKKETRAIKNIYLQQGGKKIKAGRDVSINNTQNFYSNKQPSANENIIDHYIEESRRKNKVIDRLKEQLENSLSDEERIHLSTKINRLQAELKAYEQEIKILKEQLEKYSLDIQIVKNTNDLLKRDGIDVALDYLESINFKNTLKVSQQHAKALLIKAGFYVVKNQHEKADKAFLQSIQLHRDFDNTIAYANYLFNQNKFPESIEQLLILNLESELLAEDEEATVLLNLADAYTKNNQHEDAEKAYDKALVIFRALWVENPSLYLPDVALTLNNLALLYYYSDNNLKDAEKAFSEALGIYRSLSKENPSAYLSYVAATLNNLANLHGLDNYPKDAENEYDEALEIYRYLWKENPSVYLPDVAMTLNNLGILYRSDERLKDAENAYDEALGIRRSLSKGNPSAYLPNVAETLGNIAILYQVDERLEDSEKAYNEALGIYRSLIKENPSAYLPYVATTLNNLAPLYGSNNHLKEAKKAYDEALGIRRDLSKENLDTYGIDLATTLVTGVFFINLPRENLKEARAILLKFKGISQAINYY